MGGDFLFDCCQNPKNEKGCALSGCVTAATRLRAEILGLMNSGSSSGSLKPGNV
jgi:hypothetical protein